MPPLEKKNPFVTLTGQRPEKTQDDYHADSTPATQIKPGYGGMDNNNNNNKNNNVAKQCDYEHGSTTAFRQLPHHEVLKYPSTSRPFGVGWWEGDP